VSHIYGLKCSSPKRSSVYHTHQSSAPIIIMAVDSPETKRAEARTVGVELASVLPDDGLPWYKRSHLLRLNFCILSLCLFSGSNGFDGSLLGGLLALPDWHSFMEYPEGAWLGFINAIYMLGAASAYPLAAWMCNKYGRKPGIWVGEYTSRARHYPGLRVLTTVKANASRNWPPGWCA
jgi:hypothetical protein